MRSRTSQVAPQTLLPLKPVETLVLTMLATGERHGYGIRQDVLEHTHGEIEIEAGTHQSVHSFERAIACAEALLKNLGMTDGVSESAVPEYEVYEIFDAIYFPNKHYLPSRPFQDFEVVQEGETLGRSRGNAIVASTRCHAIFGPDKIEPFMPTEEVMFLSWPVRIMKA